MNTNIVIGGIVALVVLVGGYLALTIEQEPMMDEPVSMEVSTETMDSEDMMDDAMMSDEEMMDEESRIDVGSGMYIPYDPAKVVMAEEGEVVLFFKASWCPTCRALESDIEAHLDDIPSGVTILEVNYDTATDLKTKYGVTQQHTLVQIDSDGEEITKWTGSPTLAALLMKL